jgi:hypothetical protein
MKYGRLIVLGGMLAGLATPMFADTVYGEFDASGQGGISTVTTKVGGKNVITPTGLTLGGTVGTTKAGNVRPTGTVTEDGTGVFDDFTESQSFFYHFIATGTPGMAPFLFSTVNPTTGIEFMQANSDATLGPVVTMKFYITSVADILVNSGAGNKGAAGGFDGIGYVTFSDTFAPGGKGVLFQEAVDYSVEINKGAGSKPFTLEIDATEADPAVPEPSSLALLGTGMMSVAGFVFRKRGKIQS